MKKNELTKTKFSKLEKRLFEAISEIEIIDCHEHLSPEKERLETPVDVFTLFSHYTHGDLVVAGMLEQQYQSLFNRDIPLEMRWKIFTPYWEKIRYTSYSKSVLLSVEKFYGFDDINERTYESISEAIKKSNKPGLYEEVINKSCRIKTCLTQCGQTNLGSTLLTPVMPLIYELETKESLVHPQFEKGAEIKSLDDYLNAIGRYVIRVKKEGAVGLKMVSNPYKEPNREEAISLFNKIISDKEIIPKIEGSLFLLSNPLRDYVLDWTIKLAGENDLVVAVHTGYWGDFRQLHPLHMIPILLRHPKVRFDIYHLGYPWVRETLMLGKGFPNVWLNFCWTHIISQRFAISGLDEAIDLIPTNKILAFGGDYGKPVEKIYGHLVMAKEDIVKVLTRRIEEGQFNETQALNIVRKWFWDNPIELYKLKISNV